MKIDRKKRLLELKKGDERTEEKAANTPRLKIDRKKRLLELKDEDTRHKEQVANNPGALFGSSAEDSGLKEFLTSIASRKGERKKQLQIIQDFFQHPEKYGIETNLIPTSTQRAEVEERKSELQYRVDLLRSVLTAMEGELELLSRVRLEDENGMEKSNDGSNGKSMPAPPSP
jgi:hypothetical protein